MNPNQLISEMLTQTDQYPLSSRSVLLVLSQEGVTREFCKHSWAGGLGWSDTVLSHLLSHFIPEQPVQAAPAHSSQTRHLREVWGLTWGDTASNDTAKIGILIYSSLPFVLSLLSQVRRKQDSNTNNVHPWQLAVQTPAHTGLLVPAVMRLHTPSRPQTSPCPPLTSPPSAFWQTKGEAHKVRRKESEDLKAFI